MFDAIPKPIQHDIIDRFGSPRTRQSMAQVNHETKRAMQQTDAKFYNDWLKSDFERDASAASGQAKNQYRDCLETSHEEKSRLLGIARLGHLGSLAAHMNDTHVQRQLSNRYGKKPVASAGLQIVRQLASPVGPFDSPPRLRGTELADLVRETRALHALASPSPEARQQFDTALEAAAQDAAVHVTRASIPATQVPDAPRRPSRVEICAPAQHNAGRRILGFGTELP